MSRSFVLRFPPARLSLTMRKSSSEICVNCGLPAHSPSAQTSGRLSRAARSREHSPARSTRCAPRRVAAHIATLVELDAGLFEADACGVREASRRDQDVAAIESAFARGRAHAQARFLSGSATHPEDLGIQQNVDSFLTENLLYLFSNVTVFATHELGAVFDDGHAAAEAAIGLRELKTDIAAAKHDQMPRQVIELESLDMRERLGGCQPGNVRNCRVRADIDEHLVAGKKAGAAIIEGDFESLRRHETRSPHDQLGAALLVVTQMRGHLGLDHLALALADDSHVDHDRTGGHAELGGVAHEMRSLRAPDLVLAGHAGDVRTGATDPFALLHR